MVMMSPFLITAFLATRKKARHWRRAKSREKRREAGLAAVFVEILLADLPGTFDESGDDLAPALIRQPHHGYFEHRGMLRQAALDFYRRNILSAGDDHVIVIAQAGVTVRGMRFYHPTLLNVSDHYARFLSGKGEVTIATIVR